MTTSPTPTTPTLTPTPTPTPNPTSTPTPTPTSASTSTLTPTSYKSTLCHHECSTCHICTSTITTNPMLWDSKETGNKMCNIYLILSAGTSPTLHAVQWPFN